MNALNLLFPNPHKCGLCERAVYRNGFCKLCFKEVIKIQGCICEQCGRSMEVTTTCIDCYRRKETYFKFNRSAVQYNEKMKELISLYKFRGKESLLFILAELLEETYRKCYKRIHVDALTFVPIHEKRLKERGFNQAQQLALQLSLKTKIPLQTLLKRTRYTGKQSQQGRKGRISMLAESFALEPTCSQIRTVLLIDDVYTTGSTVNECAKVLVREGGMEVYGLTVAR